MKTAIIGSRNVSNFGAVKEVLGQYEITQVISGGAIGADSMAEQYAKENDIPTLIFKPDWKKYGKAAGPIRNKDIIINSDRVIAFWDGESKGTAHSIKYALKEHKLIDVWLTSQDVYSLINTVCDIQKLLKD
jgi:hypothetical protein